MAAEENVFRKALQEGDDERAAAAPGIQKADNLAKKVQLRTVGELNLVDEAVLERSPRVRDLTVHDLNDLAAEFSGIKTDNPRVSELTLEDIQDMEAVFFDFKVATGRQVGRAGVENLTSVDVSCCCCTPCCCCAATDMSHA